MQCDQKHQYTSYNICFNTFAGFFLAVSVELDSVEDLPDMLHALLNHHHKYINELIFDRKYIKYQQNFASRKKELTSKPFSPPRKTYYIFFPHVFNSGYTRVATKTVFRPLQVNYTRIRFRLLVIKNTN